MEDPATWNEVQRTIHEAICEHEECMRLQMLGPSLETRIYRKLDAKGLLAEKEKLVKRDWGKIRDLANDMSDEEAYRIVAEMCNTTPDELRRSMGEALENLKREEIEEFGGGRISPEAVAVLSEMDDFLAKSEGMTQEEIDEGVRAIIRAHTKQE